MSSGFLPTGICPISLSVAVLTKKTWLPLKLVTARRLPSGEMAIAVRGLANLDLFDDAVSAGV